MVSVHIDGIEYQLEDMTEGQRVLLDHVADLDTKLGQARFGIDQLQVARDAFMGMLTKALNEPAG